MIQGPRPSHEEFLVHRGQAHGLMEAIDIMNEEEKRALHYEE